MVRAVEFSSFPEKNAASDGGCKEEIIDFIRRRVNVSP
jgi:hypothetical protein